MGGFTQCYAYYLFCCLTLPIFFATISISVDTLTSTQSLGLNQTLVSSSQVFEFGFFSSSISSFWYLGIWYKSIPDKTVVWVANRDTPLRNSSGILKIDGDTGRLNLLDQAGNLIWSSNHTSPTTNPVLQILDSGNLVLRETNGNDNLWQSFDFPTDTILPGMELGWNLDTQIEKRITSWKSNDDPSSGDFSYRLDYHGSPEIFVWNKQTRVYRSGPWNGVYFSGLPKLSNDAVINDTLYEDSHEVYYIPSIKDKSVLSRLVMNSTGQIQRLAWIESSQNWNTLWYAPRDQCDNYLQCGPNSICDATSFPVCNCGKGFSPKNLQAWNLREFSDGCVRNLDGNCGNDKFLPLQNMELPETETVFVNKSMTLVECKEMCLKNCSCTAYADANISNGGTGCVMWMDELKDLRHYTVGGQNLYVRVEPSVVDSENNASEDRKRRKIALIVSVPLGVLILFCFILYLAKKYKERKVTLSLARRNQNEEQVIPLFHIDTILAATCNFSNLNKIGEGGFGPVYKGKLAEGQEIAVKRLSKTSKQGVAEFMNEVELVTKLQHRNLVRVLGGCIQGEERMLVYEYMPNRSLDRFIFDPEQGKLLDWKKRYDIIMGIARGLLYLHQDSRLTIVHRDLKSSNILLDSELNPKISDFGMARIFEGDHWAVKTKQIAGTYGYMSPEYARNGVLSVSSDVFSFGVVVLEILSGIRSSYFNSNNHYNLLGKAWILWKEGRALEFMDANLDTSAIPSELFRCLQIGLLCVQKFPKDRPTMLSVVFMLGNESMILPQPKEPGFFTEEFLDCSKEDVCSSNNALSITLLEARN